MLENIQGLDLILIVAIVGFILWEAVGFVLSAGKIKMKARVFGRYASLGIVVVLLGVAIYQRRADLNGLTFWVIFGGILISSALYLLLPTGFGDLGLYFNGRLYPFAKMQYYALERETERGFTLRLRGVRREFALEFKSDEQPLALAWMDKGKVVDFETYRDTKL